MSTASVPGVAAAATRPEAHGPPDLKIYMHSPILYWWPVWAVGFLAAAWTYLDNSHLVLVPENTAVVNNQLVLPPDGAVSPVMVHMARSPIPGALFVSALLIVAVFSHVWLRGVWALFGAASLAALLLFVSWMEWWHPMLRWLGTLRVYMNLGSYLIIATVVFVVWSLGVFVFDRRTYLVFAAGQIRLRDQLGDEERAYDTGSVAFEKKPYDLFRWLVGRGAGDMVIRIGGPQPQVLELNNVIRVSKWLAEMEERLRVKDVV